MDGDSSRAQQSQPGWTYKGAAQDAAHPAPAKSKAVEWTASEYVAYNKGALWYLAVAGIGLLIAILTYALTRDTISVTAIVLITIMFAYVGGRKPRVLSYRVDDAGLTVGKKFYPYSSFKSFSLEERGAYGIIDFAPLKRFLPPLSIYFAATDGKKIVEQLARHLPVEYQQPGLIDTLSQKIRF